MTRRATNRRRVALVLELQWPYRRHVDVFLGTQRYARECGTWECVIDEYPLLKTSRTGSPAYDGIIARATGNLARQARRRGVPIVNVWHNSPASELLGVFPDFHSAGQVTARHLLERGLRRFVCVMHPRNRTHQVMFAGYREVLRDAGYACTSHALRSSDMTRSEATWQHYQEALSQWVGTWQRPIGVFVAFNDCTARYVVNACDRQGQRIPEDVALVVADNDLPVCLQPPPTLTGLDLDYERAGYDAARLLDQLMDGATPPKDAILVPGKGIHARQSTDFFATDDELVREALRFMAAHLQEPLGVNDVARGVATSRRTLERRFQQIVGQPVYAEVRRLRIERAKRLLLDTNQSVKQVALAAGFAGPVQLYQVFRRFVGLAPGEFRATGTRETKSLS
ncbi:MAG: substrate-binding domain-containing protein [Planctomycetia bacterium]|nr:substrate-binding domain-containing protein [Planctomycetia bacterium]